MFYEKIKDLSPEKFRRLTGVKKDVFMLMLDSLTSYKSIHRKHSSRGRPAKLSYANKLLLLLMYYREYRTQFHIAGTYGISESRVCEIIKEVERILICDKRFHLPGKKQLTQSDVSIELVVVDVAESPIERPKKNNENIIQAKRSDILKKHS